MDGTTIARLANAAAARMKRQGIPPVEAISAAYKEQYGGKGFDDELKHAVLRELGRRGGKKTAKTRRERKLHDQKHLQQMIAEAKILAFQRRDHLLPDP
ncbi:MAG: hypothetical protein HYY92_00260 [Parcubacteria group bacterium]|nr:hypothetical protein [Parcubacteria group bacterium]